MSKLFVSAALWMLLMAPSSGSSDSSDSGSVSISSPGDGGGTGPAIPGANLCPCTSPIGGVNDFAEECSDEGSFRCSFDTTAAGTGFTLVCEDDTIVLNAATNMCSVDGEVITLTALQTAACTAVIQNAAALLNCATGAPTPSPTPAPTPSPTPAPSLPTNAPTPFPTLAAGATQCVTGMLQTTQLFTNLAGLNAQELNDWATQVVAMSFGAGPSSVTAFTINSVMAGPGGFAVIDFKAQSTSASALAAGIANTQMTVANMVPITVTAGGQTFTQFLQSGDFQTTAPTQGPTNNPTPMAATGLLG